MSIQNRIGKLEKTKKKSNKGEIHVAIIHTCPDDPDYMIIDGERITRKEHERRNAESEAAGNKIIRVGFDLDRI